MRKRQTKHMQVRGKARQRGIKCVQERKEAWGLWVGGDGIARERERWGRYKAKYREEYQASEREG